MIFSIFQPVHPPNPSTLRTTPFLRQEFDDITTKKDIFMTPFIPYTPGFAILLNFFLMAQFSLTDHYIFGAFILVFVLYYFSYKTFKHLKKRSRPSFRFTIYKEDVESNFARCGDEREERVGDEREERVGDERDERDEREGRVVVS